MLKNNFSFAQLFLFLTAFTQLAQANILDVVPALRDMPDNVWQTVASYGVVDGLYPFEFGDYGEHTTTPSDILRSLGILNTDHYHGTPFSPNRKFFLTITPGLYSRVNIWDTHSEKLVAVLRCHKNIRSAIFSPDNKRVIAVTGDGSTLENLNLDVSVLNGNLSREQTIFLWLVKECYDKHQPTSFAAIASQHAQQHVTPEELDATFHSFEPEVQAALKQRFFTCYPSLFENLAAAFLGGALPLLIFWAVERLVTPAVKPITLNH